MRSLFHLFIILFSFAQVSVAHGHWRPDGCESLLGPLKPITLHNLKESARDRIARNELLAKIPTFDNIEVESQVEQTGEHGPMALQQLLGLNMTFVSTPAPTSPDVATVSLIEEARSLPVHVDLNWAGHRTSTTVYASLPGPIKTNGFLVGPEYPVVLVHLHGGGTPTATGKNGVNIGEKMVALGVPVLAPDMPGHGRATRNPEGLMSFSEQADWLMAVLRQVVHPNVKVVLSGHSWGGMFAIYMYLHSSEPRFQNIAQFIALSPGVDASMGGTPEERVAANQWYEKNYHMFKDKIAAADFEFQENILNNGKDSDIGAFFTNFTNIDYSTPPLTVKMQENLKPLTVVVGTADGVVFVGREKPFDEIFGSLTGHSRYIKLPPGRSWKSKDESDLQATGHNIFDRYTDGTTDLQVYGLIGDILLKESGASQPAEADKADLIVNDVFRHYANFFAFREMVSHHNEYVVIPTADLAAISSRKVEIDEFNRKIEALKTVSKRDVDAAVNTATAALRTQLGITEALNLDRAQGELNLPELTEERRASIEGFIRSVEKIDVDLRESFRDLQAENDEKALVKEFASTLEQIGVSQLADYKPKLDALLTEKVKDKATDKLRSELGRLHQKFLQIQKGRQSRFGLERDRHLASLKSPTGITDLRSALRELRADRSQERRRALERFVSEVQDVQAAARATAEKIVEAKLEAVPKPTGVSSLVQAEELRVEMDSRLNFSYVPSSSPDIRKLTIRMQELEVEQERINHGQEKELTLERLESSTRTLRRKRSGLIKRWEGLWGKGILSSSSLTQMDASFERTLASFKEIYHQYENAKSIWLTEIKNEGRWTADVVLKQTPELLALRRRVQHAKKVFMDAHVERNARRWADALAGQLSGPEGAVKEAVKMAQEHKSTEEILSSQEDYFEARRQKLSLIHREIDERRLQYVEAMLAARESVPYRIERVAIWDTLNQPLGDLLDQVRGSRVVSEALIKTLSRWDAMLSELRSEH